jgi:hypothetical protein
MKRRTLLSCLAVAPVTGMAATSTVYVNAALKGRATGSLQGFLSGVSSGVDGSMVMALKPKLWRVGYWDAHVYVKPTGVKTQIVLTDAFGPAPYNDWTLYENNLRSIVAQSMHGPYVDYWDVANEPDNFWTGTPDQFLELLHRSHNAIRSVDPNAKLVAPSISHFDPIILNWVLDYIAAQGLTYSALSWHEFDSPAGLGTHCNDARAMLAARNLSMEIHINEFSAGQNHLIPGWTAAWLSALERAGVNWANRACWQTLAGESECATGLDGLLTTSQNAQQAPYWVHKSYADMTGQLIMSSTSDPSLSCMASINTATRDTWLMIGRASCGANGNWCRFADHAIQDAQTASGNVNVSISAFPWSRATAFTVEIPYSNQSGPSGTGPVSSVALATRRGVITVPLGSVADGAVKVVRLVA